MSFLKHFFLTVSVFALVFSSYGQAKTEGTKTQYRQDNEEKKNGTAEDSEEGSFSKIKVKNWDDSKEKPKIENDRQNVIIEKKSDISNSEKTAKSSKKKGESSTPPSSTAAKIALSDKVIEWKPQWRYKGIGGPWLPDANLSPDLSLIAIVETTGKDDGPYGSRIVFVNTYNWNIVRIIELDRKISRICYVPTTEYIICWAEKQLSLKQPHSLLLVDCKSGNIISASNLIKDQISSLACDSSGERLFAKSAENNDIYIFNAQDFQKKPKILKSKSKGGSATSSADNSILAVAGENILEIFNYKNYTLLKTVNLPDGFNADKILFAGDSRMMAISSQDEKVLFLRGDVQKIISDFYGNVLFFNPKNNILTVGRENKGNIVVLSVPSLDEIATFAPKNVKPATYAPIILAEYLPNRDGIVMLDEHGNMYLMTQPSKRWKKTMIFSAKKQ
ncbi:MAG: hypothetical protein A2017_18390 [Lentisphaerae bacterium GWF2_44_16]|nr:MAG: hypothetical protein A2017_18390 [Lentisphaerae bacterium GWF2_44_16]